MENSEESEAYQIGTSAGKAFAISLDVRFRDNPYDLTKDERKYYDWQLGFNYGVFMGS